MVGVLTTSADWRWTQQPEAVGVYWTPFWSGIPAGGSLILSPPQAERIVIAVQDLQFSLAAEKNWCLAHAESSGNFQSINLKS